MRPRRKTLAGKTLTATALFVAALWLAEALLDYFWFGVSGEGIAHVLLPFDDLRELVDRMLFVGAVAVGGVVVWRVLSRLERSESQAQGLAENLRITLDSIGDAVIATDLHGTIVRMNPVAERLTGWTCAEARGKPLAEVFKIIDARTRELAVDPTGKALDSGAAVNMDNHTELVAKDGSEHQIADSAAPIRDARGAVVGVVLVFRDVTGEYRMREALRRSEAKCRLLVEHSSELIWNMDADGVFLDLSPSWSRVTGYEPSTLIGTSFVPLVHPDDVAVCHAFLRRMVTAKEISRCPEYRVKRSDGSWRWHVTEGAPVLGPDGAFVSLVGVSHDITERKRAEEALRESSQRLKLAADAAAFGVWDWDLGSGRLEWDDWVFRLHGLAHLDATETFAAWRKAVHPDDLGRVESLLEQAREGERDFDTEYRALWADGQIRNLKAHAVVSRDATGKAIRMTGINYDITELKRAEEALQTQVLALTRPLDDASSLRFTDLFNLDSLQRIQDAFSDSTGVASIITDADGTPITKPSNFCALCIDIIRASPKGFANCCKSDAFLGRLKSDGPTIQPCLSGGLWDAGASIHVGGKHVANWLIGQVRNDALDEGRMMAYADEIGADRETFRKALAKVPVMPIAQFEKVAKTLYLLANELSLKAYQNVQQARFINERKHAEEALRKAESYIANIIDSMPSLLIGVDGDGVVTQWNQRAERSTGVAAKDALRHPLAQVIPRLSPEMERVRQAIAARQTQSSPKRARQENGQTVYEDVTVYPLVANGVEGAVIRVDDVTERVRIEELMVQNEKMLSLGGLAAGMAHEINNPLGIILQGVENIQRRSLADLPANRAAAAECGVELPQLWAYMRRRGLVEFINDVRSAGTRAADIVSNMLQFSRGSKSHFAPHDLRALIDSVVTLAASDYDLKKQYDFRHVKIVLDIALDLPPVPCVENEIKQVLLNLLKNAAQAMAGRSDDSQRPQITIAASRVGEMAVVEVADNGPGMEEQVRRRIFEPFFTTKEVGIGTGIGLSISYFIVTGKHKGSLEVRSALGRGTKFTIMLPLKPG